MLARAIERFSDLVTRRRALVLGVSLAVVAACASQLPRLRVDSAPEELMIARAGYRDDAREFRRLFGDTDSVVALLVGADDVTARAPLGYVHALSRHFESAPHVRRVASITITPLPGAPDTDSGETLDDLDTRDAAAPPPEIEHALETLIAVDPERFPLGLVSVVERMGDGSADVRGVVRGDEVTESEAAAIRAALDDAPLVVGRLVSRDRRLAAVVVFLDPAIGTGEARIAEVHAMDAWLAAHPPPDGVTLDVTGIPHLRAAIRDAMLSDQLVLVPLALLVCIGLLYASFRWIAGVVLPITMVALSVVCVLGGMALLGEPLSILMNTLPTLIVIMGIAEAVHVVARYVEESRRTANRIEASRRALRSLAIACFLTSFTTSVGFGALIVAQTEMLRRFGVAAALGVMVSYVLLMTFVPAAITLFPRPVHARDPEAARRAGRLEAVLVRATSAIAKRPLPVVLVTIALAVPAAWAYASVHVDTALLETFDARDPIAVSTRLVEQNLDGILPLEVHVRSRGSVDLRDPEVLAALDRIAAWARTEDGVLRVTTPGDVLWEPWRRIAGLPSDAPRTPFRSRAQVEALVTLLGRVEPNPIRAWLTDDGRHARVEVRLADVGAVRSIALIDGIAEHARAELAAFEGVDVVLVGEALVGATGVTAVVQDLFGSLTLSALVIFLLIGLLFRSAKLGVLAIPPNVLPQIGTVGWMVLRGIPLNAGTAIVFSVAIGVSVDLTIHGFARLVEEERRGMSRRAAIVRVARSTGRAVVVSCATLVIGFSVLMGSGFVPVRHFGELIAVALSLSLAATLVFQPAMMALVRERGHDLRKRSA